MTILTLEEWNKKGEELFGEDRMKWRWKCPVCHYVATTQDYKDAGAPVGAVGFSCVGRYLKGKHKTIFEKDTKGNGPCNYTTGGLFSLNPINVTDEEGTVHEVFEFALPECEHEHLKDVGKEYKVCRGCAEEIYEQ